ncbi:MAG: hypothetical protein GOVbin1434_42 [Prokaryotic dsDNA virus sp.]|nr:MAG: hypothetical protein GOVbin1434_42 [Prokaryotic dsDNA virus sp.]
MVCEECKKRKIKKIIKDSKEAIIRFNKKLKEESKCHTQVNKKAIGLKEK